MFKKLDHWHRTRLGVAIFAVVELALAYIFASLSINNGNLLCYLLTLIFFVGFLQNTGRLLKRIVMRRHV